MKKCRSCHHDWGSHYKPGSGDSGSSSHGDSGGDAGDTNSSDNNSGQLPTSLKNKMTVSSLVADLINGGDCSMAEVKNAKNEAKAGLTRKQVCSTFTRSQK